MAKWRWILGDGYHDCWLSIELKFMMKNALFSCTLNSHEGIADGKMNSMKLHN